MNDPSINYRMFMDHFHSTLMHLVANIKQNTNIFYDKRTIPEGKKWNESIKEHAENSDAMIIIIHDNWEESFLKKKNATDGDWVKKEILCALENPNTAIYPIRINRTKEIEKTDERIPEEIRLHTNADNLFYAQNNIILKVNQEEDLLNKLNSLVDAISECYNKKSSTATFLPQIIKKGVQITPEDILSERGKIEKGFRERYYFSRVIVDDKIGELLESKKRVLIYGKSMSGKSRAIYKYIKDHKKDANIILVNNDNIEKLHKAVENDTHEKIALTNGVVIMDEIYRLNYHNSNKFQIIYEKLKSLPILASCTEDEYKLLRKSRETSDFVNNITDPKFFGHINIPPLSTEEIQRIKKELGLDREANADTIGTLLGVETPWHRIDDEIAEDSLPGKILDAIKNIGFIKTGNVDLKDVLNYLSSENESYNSRDIEGAVNRLVDFGVILSFEKGSYCQDLELKIDPLFKKERIDTLIYHTVKSQILENYKTNKNIARLIAKTKDQRIIDDLHNNHIIKDEDNIHWVHNAWVQQKFDDFEKAKEKFESIYGQEVIFDIVTYKTLARLCKKDEDIKYVLEHAHKIPNTDYETDEAYFQPKRNLILNELLRNHSIDKIKKIGNDIPQKIEFQYNTNTYLLILKSITDKEEAKKYYYNNNLQRELKAAKELIRKFNLNLSEYQEFIKGFFSTEHENLDNKNEIQILFNLSLKHCRSGYIELYKWGKEQEIEPDHITTNTILSKFPNKGKLINELKKDKDLFNIRILNSLIQNSITFSQAYEWFERIQAPDDYSYNFLISKIKTKNDYETIKRKLRDAGKRFEYALGSLVNIRLKMGYQPVEIFNEFEEETNRNVFEFNYIIIGELIKNTTTKEAAFEIYQQALKKKYELPIDIYNQLINIEDKGDIELIGFCEKKFKNEIDIYFYKAILGNLSYPQTIRDKYYQAYITKIKEDKLEFDENCILNYLKSESTFSDKLSKSETIQEDYKFEYTPLFITEITKGFKNEYEAIISFGKENKLPTKVVSNVITYLVNEKKQGILNTLKDFDKEGILTSFSLNKTLKLFTDNHKNVTKKGIETFSEDQNQTKYEFIQTVIETFNTKEYLTRPDIATYAEWINCADTFEKAKFAYEACLNSRIKPNHRLYINLLKKADNIENFEDIFSLLSEEILMPNKESLDTTNLQSTFNIWYDFIEKRVENEQEKNNCHKNRKKNELEFGYEEDSYRLTSIIKYDNYKGVKEWLEEISKNGNRNIEVYNTLIYKCKNLNELNDVYTTIKKDFFIGFNIDSFLRIFIQTSKFSNDNQSVFEFLYEVAIKLKEFLPEAPTDKDKNKLRTIANHWSFKCTSLNNLKRIKEFFPHWKIKICEETEVILDNISKTISTLEDASFLYEHSSGNRAKRNELYENLCINNCKEEVQKRNEQLADCTTIDELKVLKERYPLLKVSSDNRNIWYQNLIKTITTLQNAKHFIHCIKRPRHFNVTDLVYQLQTNADRKEFFHFIEKEYPEINYNQSRIKKILND
ncbi:toll/interleukin-1 receptor domain-containing protein [Maribellus sp. CM-23]|uniref:TIR domain-containing protein n=1 Tax=Maribellus sp. CM-23 TaxID=2781026 RepID=UPI001F4335C2|nr:toll/interleukin-1 receptor domain-containing protein [Maribellus sp. CM-23]